jgi:hypothetical protein
MGSHHAPFKGFDVEISLTKTSATRWRFADCKSETQLQFQCSNRWNVSPVNAVVMSVGRCQKPKIHKGKIMETAFERNMKSRVIKAGLALSALAITGMLVSANATTSAGSTASTVATPPRVLIFDQKVTGNEVSVEYANLQRNGYVVIYPSTTDGKPNKEPLGQTSLKAGDHRNVKVKLNSVPQPGATLWASLYVDADNQPGFDKSKDTSVWPDAIPSSNRFLLK